MKNKWTVVVFFLTFILACIFSVIATFLGNLNNYFLVVATLVVIMIGIVFDVIGTAVLSCDIKVFHSKASQKIRGSKQAVNLAKNASRVSSVCNDVIGDICGIISGSLSAVLVINLFSSNVTFANVIVSATLSSLTVGGKALGKAYAISNANVIVFKTGKFLSNFTRKR